MRVVGVVPARFGSQRFPGKPLAKILGKPMIQWVLEGARESKKLDALYLATDHEEIAKVAKGMGIPVVLTASDLPSGTDRVYHALSPQPPDVVINIQGDEPMIRGKHIDALIEVFEKDAEVQVATLAYKSPDPEGPDRVKIVTDLQGFALYFSRSPIPYYRFEDTQRIYWIHVGVYGYRWPALETWVQHPPTPLERVEGLEQLRALQLQMKIKVVSIPDPCIPVDRPEDLEKVAALLQRQTS